MPPSDSDQPEQAERSRLHELIRVRSLLTGGTFTLASGRESNLFFDMKRSMLDAEGANLIADAILDRIDPAAVDAVGGVVMGAVPIMAVVCAKSFAAKRFTGRPLQGFFVRKEPKDHGTGRLIDGNLERGARAIILEDVTTTGGSSLAAVEAVRDHGASVVGVITVVDRGEGAAELFRMHGIPFSAIFGRDDFV
jgi:orotate phosphoribosyltransferase